MSFRCQNQHAFSLIAQARRRREKWGEEGNQDLMLEKF